MFASRSAVIVALLLTSDLALGCAAAPAEEEGEASADAITGSPSEERAKQQAALERAYVKKVLAAYAAADLGDFSDLPGGKGLVGEAATDYAAMQWSCTLADGYKLSAQRWSVTTQASVTDTSAVARRLFTVDAFNQKNKKTMIVAVYTEGGALIVGQRYLEKGDIYARESALEFRNTIRACQPPLY